MLEKIIKEKISADHLLYVSMKYTKTCDVMINLVKRWAVMIEDSIDGLLIIAKKKKMIKKIPTAPKLRVDAVKEVFRKESDVLNAIELYSMFKLVDILKQTKEQEFRKGVCLSLFYKGQEIRINLEKLKEYSEILERFINFVKRFLSS